MSDSWTCNGIPKDGKDSPYFSMEHEPHTNTGEFCDICSIPRSEVEVAPPNGDSTGGGIPKSLLIGGGVALIALILGGVFFFLRNRICGIPLFPACEPDTVVYENDEFGFEITHPPDWIEDEKTPDPDGGGFFCEQEIVTLQPPIGVPERSLEVGFYRPNPDKDCKPYTLIEYLDTVIRQIIFIQTSQPVEENDPLTCDPTITINKSQISCQSITLGNLPAYQLEFTNDEQENIRQYLVSQGDDIYILTYKVDSTEAEDVAEKDNMIIQSFQFINN